MAEKKKKKSETTSLRIVISGRNGDWTALVDENK